MVKKDILDESQKKLEELEKQVNEYLDGWKRCKADFENYKKQQQDSLDNFRLYATEDILLKIIPVVDNFELAVNHIPQTPENKPWREGILHIKKQLDDILTSHGVKKIDSKAGDLFDPILHECVEKSEPSSASHIECEKDSENPKNSPVIDKIVRNGYTIGDKLLRPVQVTIKNK